MGVGVAGWELLAGAVEFVDLCAEVGFGDGWDEVLEEFHGCV